MTEYKKENGFRLLVRLVVVVAIILILAAIAIPNFLKFSARAKQSEAKQNLQAIYKAYQAYHSANGTYPIEPTIQIGVKTLNCFSAADWIPTGRIRNTYECMGVPVYWTSWDTGTSEPQTHCVPPIVTKATKDSFTVAACGNLDNDTFIDEWTINNQGELVNIFNDITNEAYNAHKKSWW